MNHDHPTTGNTNRHILLMMLCCLIPIALIAAVALFRISFGALTPYLPFVMVLFCPLLMFFMMRGMIGQDHAGEDSPHAKSPQNTSTKPNRTATTQPGTGIDTPAIILEHHQ